MRDATDRPHPSGNSERSPVHGDCRSKPFGKEKPLSAYRVVGDFTEELKPEFFVKATRLKIEGVEPHPNPFLASRHVLGLGHQCPTPILAPVFFRHEDHLDDEPVIGKISPQASYAVSGIIGQNQSQGRDPRIARFACIKGMQRKKDRVMIGSGRDFRD